MVIQEDADHFREVSIRAQNRAAENRFTQPVDAVNRRSSVEQDAD
jgi:hypothetical protein